MVTKKFDAGKWAENEAETWLTARSAKELGFAYHRYPDARAARGALAAQPADFLVARKVLAPDGSLVRKEVWHLEIKETAHERRLPRAKVGQYGKLLLFNYAGITPLVVVYASHHRGWCVLTADDLFPSGFDDEPLTSFLFNQKTMYASCGQILQELFK